MIVYNSLTDALSFGWLLDHSLYEYVKLEPLLYDPFDYHHELPNFFTQFHQHHHPNNVPIKMPFDHDDLKHMQVQVQDVDVVDKIRCQSLVARGRHYRGVRQRPQGEFVVEKRA
ncbi:hypothetical protein PRUPE_3G108800 [Prunus persica]|uniref:Uncharacterized protein n=1 Tax=Prunus persica TaxID=3760 RepID=A0A251Q1N0_PRUPE|nr:hypothetical protein PRUPE_3G108800 [Prunus persica]